MPRCWMAQRVSNDVLSAMARLYRALSALSLIATAGEVDECLLPHESKADRDITVRNNIVFLINTPLMSFCKDKDKKQITFGKVRKFTVQSSFCVDLQCICADLQSRFRD